MPSVVFVGGMRMSVRTASGSSSWTAARSEGRSSTAAASSICSDSRSRAVVLSAHDDEAYALALLGRGQSGLAYLLKDRIAQGDELVLAITEVAAGGSRVDPTIASRLSNREEADDVGTRVLEMMASGFTYADMARELGTTQEGVDRTVTELVAKPGTEGGRGAANRVGQA